MHLTNVLALACVLLCTLCSTASGAGFSTFVVGPPVHEMMTALAARLAGVPDERISELIERNLAVDFPGVGLKSDLSLGFSYQSLNGDKDMSWAQQLFTKLATIPKGLLMKRQLAEFTLEENQPKLHSVDPDTHLYKLYMKPLLRTPKSLARVIFAKDRTVRDPDAEATDAILRSHYYEKASDHAMLMCDPREMLDIRGIGHCPRLSNKKMRAHIRNHLYTPYKRYSSGGDEDFGAALHTIQDSFAGAHVARLPKKDGQYFGDVAFFQDYADEDGDKHGVADARLEKDADGNIAEYNKDRTSKVKDASRRLMDSGVGAAAQLAVAHTLRNTVGVLCLPISEGLLKVKTMVDGYFSRMKEQLDMLAHHENIRDATIASAAYLAYNYCPSMSRKLELIGTLFHLPQGGYSITSGGTLAEYRHRECPSKAADIFGDLRYYLNFNNHIKSKPRTTGYQDINQGFMYLVGASFNCQVKCRNTPAEDKLGIERYGKMCMSLRDGKYRFDECCLHVSETERQALPDPTAQRALIVELQEAGLPRHSTDVSSIYEKAANSVQWASDKVRNVVAKTGPLAAKVAGRDLDCSFDQGRWNLPITAEKDYGKCQAVRPAQNAYRLVIAATCDRLEFNTKVASLTTKVASPIFNQGPCSFDTVYRVQSGAATLFVKNTPINGARNVDRSGPRDVVLAFRGFSKILDDSLGLIHTKQTECTSGGKSCGQVHTGLYNDVEPILGDAELISALTGVCEQRGCTITVTGRSMGGGQATLAALMLKLRFPEYKVNAITFGSCRVGNPDFVRIFNEKIDHSERYISRFQCHDMEGEHWYADDMTMLPHVKGQGDYASAAMLLQTSAGDGVQFWGNGEEEEEGGGKKKSGLGGWFSRRRADAARLAQNLHEQAEAAKEHVRESVAEIKESASRFGDAVREHSGDVIDHVKREVDEVKREIAVIGNDVKRAVDKGFDHVRAKANDVAQRSVRAFSAIHGDEYAHVKGGTPVVCRLPGERLSIPSCGAAGGRIRQHQVMCGNGYAETILGYQMAVELTKSNKAFPAYLQLSSEETNE